MVSQKFNLTLNTNETEPIVYCNQYDVGRVYEATIYDVDRNLYSFSDESVVVCGTKPSGMGFRYSSDVTTSTWAASTSYAIGDYVTYSSVTYRCIEAHTSGTSFDSSYWSTIMPSITCSGNTVTFTLTEQMTVVAGMVRCGIIITKDNVVVGTLTFKLSVQKAALTTDTVIG